MDKSGAEFDLITVDGKNLLFRACHAFGDLSVEVDGVEVPTGAVYGFLSVLTGVYQRYGGSIVVCWESPNGESIRRDRYADYKPWKHDPDSPYARTANEVSAQIDPLQYVLSVAGVHQYRAVGYEADDVMATIAKVFANEGGQAGIYTADTDLMQCVRDGVRVIRPRNNKKGRESVYDASDVLDEFGVKPEQWPSYLALKGDTSDNIPGVRGIGKVNAVKLLSRLGTWSAIRRAAIECSSDLTESTRNKIIDGAASGDLSLELATIMYAENIEAMHVERNVPLLKKIFTEMKFKSLMRPAALSAIIKMGR